MWPIFVRTPKNGDRISTKIGHKKLSRIFINHKIPRLEREQWPIITDKFDNILWVVGLEKSNTIDNYDTNCYIFIEVK
jgi:tRNA(Ile)-lysidine synthetase-like protein